VLSWRLLRHPQHGTAPRFMTKSPFTTHWENVDRFKKDADRIVRSFRLLP
jgi:hypothetical protein